MQLVTVESIHGHHGADAVLVEGHRIAAIGLSADLMRSESIVVGYPGATIVPGLRDAHLHPVGYAAALVRPSLKEARDFADVADIVARAAAAQAPGTAITGLRLDDEGLAEQRLPDRHLLDSVVPDRPVILIRYCGHVAVANTAALDMSGIDASTPDPVGGGSCSGFISPRPL